MDYYYRHRNRILNERHIRMKDDLYREHHNAIKRASLLRCRYGITPQQYAEQLKSQDNGCAICGSKTSNNGKSIQLFDIDHCHYSGKIRGILCRDCNVTVGVVEKKWPKILLILEYLKQHIEFD